MTDTPFASSGSHLGLSVYADICLLFLFIGVYFSVGISVFDDSFFCHMFDTSIWGRFELDR